MLQQVEANHYTIVLLLGVQHEICCAHDRLCWARRSRVQHIRSWAQHISCWTTPSKTIVLFSPLKEPKVNLCLKTVKNVLCRVSFRRQKPCFRGYLTSNDEKWWQCNASFNEDIQHRDVMYIIWRQSPTSENVGRSSTNQIAVFDVRGKQL